MDYRKTNEGHGLSIFTEAGLERAFEVIKTIEASRETHVHSVKTLFIYMELDAATLVALYRHECYERLRLMKCVKKLWLKNLPEPLPNGIGVRNMMDSFSNVADIEVTGFPENYHYRDYFEKLVPTTSHFGRMCYAGRVFESFKATLTPSGGKGVFETAEECYDNMQATFFQRPMRAKHVHLRLGGWGLSSFGAIDDFLAIQELKSFTLAFMTPTSIVPPGWANRFNFGLFGDHVGRQCLGLPQTGDMDHVRFRNVDFEASGSTFDFLMTQVSQVPHLGQLDFTNCTVRPDEWEKAAANLAASNFFTFTAENMPHDRHVIRALTKAAPQMRSITSVTLGGLGHCEGEEDELAAALQKRMQKAKRMCCLTGMYARYMISATGIEKKK